jgi:hypothetical protein
MSMSKTKSDPKPTPQGLVISLSPDSAQYGSPPFTLRVIGGLFTVNSGIAFAGGSKVTTYVNPNEVTCQVDWTVITGPGVVQVWVVTDGVSTDAAPFTVTPAVTPPPSSASNPDDVLTRQLRAWGVSGEPIRWAPDMYQASIVAVRAANTGFGTVSTAQGVMDSSFPFNHLVAKDICLPHAPADAPAIRVTSKDGHSRLRSVDLADLELPVENITWLVDGDVAGHGPDIEVVELPPGEHEVAVVVAVAGMLYQRRETVGEPVS